MRKILFSLLALLLPVWLIAGIHKGGRSAGELPVAAMAMGTFVISRQNPVVLRYSGTDNDTLGLLFLDGVFQHYTVEDAFHESKIPGRTRIPAGTYPLRLIQYGRHHEEYEAKFPEIHKGMILIDNVPDYKGILYHIGNDANDTEGCLLCGDTANNNRLAPASIALSTQAYVRTYPKLASYIRNNKKPVIEYVDLDINILQ